jgi:hypothetical protein
MNKPKIFNHDIMGCTVPNISGKYLYCGRALALTEPNDIIQLHPVLERDWDTITAHYQRIGLSHSQTVIWDLSLETMTRFPNDQISVYYFGDSSDLRNCEWFQARDLRRSEVVRQVNCKNQFIQLAESFGITVPKTLRFRCKSEIRWNQKLPYPCYVKVAVSVSGIGIYRCKDEIALRWVLSSDLHEGVPLQIQQEVLATRFLNLQYEVTEFGAQPLAATEQLLQGCTHIGNRYPTSDQPWNVVAPLANWMMTQGMQEIFAFDVAVVETVDQPNYYAIECNPRFNGSSYPTYIARKLHLREWISERFQTVYRSLAAIDLTGLEYDASSGAGVILVNWGIIQMGKLDVLIAGSPIQQQEIRSQIQQRLLAPQLMR